MSHLDWVSIVSLVVSAIALWFTALQSGDSRRSACSAERSATAAEQAARSAFEGGRAWVLLRGVPIGTNAKGLPVQVTVIAKNFGQTPALNLRAGYYWKLFPAGPGLEYPPLPTPQEVSQGTLGSGDECSLPFEMTYSEKEADSVVRSEGKLYLWGCFGYEDVFLKTRKTYWCLEYVPGIQNFAYAVTGNSVE